MIILTLNILRVASHMRGHFEHVVVSNLFIFKYKIVSLKLYSCSENG